MKGKINDDEHVEIIPEEPQVPSLFETVVRNRRGGALYPHPSDNARLSIPSVWEFLTRTTVDEECTKEPAKITITLTSGGFAVELIDSALGIMVSAVSDRLLTALEALERVLSSPNVPVKYFKDHKTSFKRIEGSPSKNGKAT